MLVDIEGKILSGRVYPEFYRMPDKSMVVNLGCGSGPQMVVYKGQFDKMIGIDINKSRIERSIEVANEIGVENYEGIVGNVEATDLDDAIADVVLAFDIIEHVKSPERLVAEAHRVLKSGGSLVITYPTMHDHYQDWGSTLKWLVTRSGSHNDLLLNDEWDPDVHNNHKSVRGWIDLTTEAGFTLVNSRATTMFPPLHLYGVPRFWFKWNLVHAVDSVFARMPGVKRFGQALVCRFDRDPG
jgi:SAM-dependent methyltransferase